LAELMGEPTAAVPAGHCAVAPPPRPGEAALPAAPEEPSPKPETWFDRLFG
jgi:hypothetical protein